MLRLALLISGGGTTMEQILLACYNGLLKGLVEPVLVIASEYGIGGIDRARRVGFPEKDIMICDPKMFQFHEQWGQTLEAMLRNYRVDLVGQYGWMLLTPANVIEIYKNRIINQHNGPLDTGRPDFGGQGCYGRRTHCARLFFARRSGRVEDQFTEATAHIVTPVFDKGYVIGRRRIDILPDDDPISLAGRLLPFEHELQVAVLKRIAEGTVAPQFRNVPLVSPDQYELLAEAKMVAGMLFPKG